MSRLNKVISIKLARQPEHQAGLSDLGSNLPRLAYTWVGRILLSLPGCPKLTISKSLDVLFIKGYHNNSDYNHKHVFTH